MPEPKPVTQGLVLVEMGTQWWVDLSLPWSRRRGLPKAPSSSYLPNPSRFQAAAALRTSCRDVGSHQAAGGRTRRNQWAASIYCNGLWFGSMAFFLLLIIVAVHHAKAVLEAKTEVIPSLQRRKTTH